MKLVVKSDISRNNSIDIELKSGSIGGDFKDKGIHIELNSPHDFIAFSLEQIDELIYAFQLAKQELEKL